LAMGIGSALCIGIGVWPQPLYDILPYEVDYHAYSVTHVITQLQLLMWSALAFTVLNQWGIYPPELRSVNLDTDWFYRRPFRRSGPGERSAVERLVSWLGRTRATIDQAVVALLQRALSGIRMVSGPDGISRRTASIGAMAVWVAILLTGYLVFYYLSSLG